MGNAVSLFSNGSIAIPEYLKNIELDDATRKLAGNGGGMRISIKGGVFRLMNGGEEISRNEDRAMNFIIVASSPDVSRTYYDGAYDENNIAPPTCWSTDDKMPDASVPADQKQSDTCAACKQNIAGSGQNDSRACRYSRRLAVKLENDPKGGVYQVQLPAKSIFGKAEADGKMPLQAYAKLLVQHKLPISAVVTEFRFDTNEATPKLTFKPVRPLTEEEYASAKAAGESQEAQEAIKFTVYQTDTKGKPATETANIFTQPTSPEQAAAAQKPEASPPKRTRAKPAEAVKPAAPAEPVVNAADDDEEAQLVAALAAMKAKKAAAAKAAEAKQEEPVITQQKAPPPEVAAPAGVESVLEKWDDDDDA